MKLSPETLDDDAARPKAPALPQLTPSQQQAARRLSLIHAMHLRDVDAVAGLMEDIRNAVADPSSLAPALAKLPLTRNMERFGTLCGSQCRALQGHHDIEEAYIFPELAHRGDERVRPLLDRLHAEHEVIHALIDDLRREAAHLAKTGDPFVFGRCVSAFKLLDKAIRSHFGYEDSELVPALGAYDVPV